VLGKSVNQKNVLHENLEITNEQLLDVSSVRGGITESGIRSNIRVSLLYLESWLNGIGAAALYNLMEDAATAEISRAQLWQWLRHSASIEGGKVFTEKTYRQTRREELDLLMTQFQNEKRETNFLQEAQLILDRLVLHENFEDFLTIRAYDHLF
jgi:malate synthase